MLDTRNGSKESQENLTIDLWCIWIWYSSRGNQIQDLFTSKQSNQSIKTVTNYFLMKPMLFSNLELHLTTTRSSTFSGFKLALMGVTTLPATEKTRSNLDEVAGTGKTLLTSLARRGTESRDASPITAGPLWTAHQATVGKTSFFTPWGTLNFFSSSYSSSFTISLLFCACRWFLKALVEPWQTLMTKAEPEMMNTY